MEETLLSFKENLTIEYFKSLRSEIHLRLQEHHKLWFYKIISCGAILSFSLSKGGLAEMGCVIVPLVALIVDFLIFNNLIIINALGQYICKEIESKHYKEGWETKSRETYISGPKYSWFSDWVIAGISTILISFVSIYAAVQGKLLVSNLFSIVMYIIFFTVCLYVYIFPFIHMSEK